MGEVDWKTKAKELARLHTERGRHGSVVPIRVQFAPTDLEMIEAANVVGTVEGPVLTPRQIRKFLFEVKDQPGMLDQEGAIYSVYDAERDQSTVGVGVMRSVTVDS